MKFTKEQALESIKAKFVGKSGNTSQKVSDITISDTIESLLKIEGVVTDETELDGFVEKILPSIKALNNNIIKEQSDFVKNYKPEPPAAPKTETKVKDEDPKPETGKTDQEALKAIFQEIFDARLNPVMQELNSMKKEREKQLRGEQLSTLTESLKLTKDWKADFDIAMELATLKLGEDASADDVFTEAKSRFNKTLSAKGQTYAPVDGSGGEGEGTSPLKGYIDKVQMERKAAAEKSKGLGDFLGISGEAKK
ncbi:MAG: hypothetical protein WC262_08435 [Bacteroidales bacterium]|jgi:hypothetical protein